MLSSIMLLLIITLSIDARKLSFHYFSFLGIATLFSLGCARFFFIIIIIVHSSHMNVFLVGFSVLSSVWCNLSPSFKYFLLLKENIHYLTYLWKWICPIRTYLGCFNEDTTCTIVDIYRKVNPSHLGVVGILIMVL